VTVAGTRPERHLATHVFNVVVLVIGAGALVWMLHELGWQNVKRVLAGVGGWFAVIVAFDVAALACEAAAIHQFMQPEQRMVAYWRVLAAQASGRAINILTPGGALGEATKITLLVAHAPRARVVTSIVLLNLASFYLSVAILIVGVPITALLVDLPHHLQVVVWIGLGIVVPLVVGVALVIRRGAADTVLGAARQLGVLSAERREKWAVRLRDVDRQLRELQSNRSPGTRSGLLLIVAGRLCGWTATTLVLIAVGVHVGPSLLVGVFSVGVLIGWMSAFIPFGLGVADGGNYALFAVLGAPAASGVFVTLIGRARSLTLAVLGLVVMAAAHTSSRLEISRRNRLIARLAAQHGPESPARSG
jgi:uncharacterized membrane protein YbhN (UPF0104 family)